jgi:23S rRNA (uracil1939-C5)-methyltransferase
MKNKNKNNLPIELSIESIAFEGVALARKDGVVHFVRRAIPEEIVLAKVTKKRKRYLECEVMEVLKSSPNRVLPKCKHFGVCGGCSWQHLDYPEQLKWKERTVLETLKHLGKITPEIINNIIPSEPVYNYRNKMEFSFGPSRWLTTKEIDSGEKIVQKDFALGLHIPERFDKVLDISECPIAPEISIKILDRIRAQALMFGCKAYNTATHEGFLRNVVIRNSLSYQETMCILITDNPKETCDEDFLKWFETEFVEEFKDTSIIHAVNTSFSPVAIGIPKLLNGKTHLIEEILGIKYKISPFSFFQTNSYQLNPFVSKIIRIAELETSNTVWDLYCGTGSISLPIARKINKIIGLELSESSIEDAKENAKLNEIDNVDFFSFDLHSKEFWSFASELPKPDAIILDPPRSGSHENLLKLLKSVSPAKLVYVSCNPATLARDCQFLSDNFYLKEIQAIDMFPQTYHVETIALLLNKEK